MLHTAEIAQRGWFERDLGCVGGGGCGQWFFAKKSPPRNGQGWL